MNTKCYYKMTRFHEVSRMLIYSTCNEIFTIMPDFTWNTQGIQTDTDLKCLSEDKNPQMLDYDVEYNCVSEIVIKLITYTYLLTIFKKKLFLIVI